MYELNSYCKYRCVVTIGTNIKQLPLHCVSLPRVHPNILGPGLAQFPVLDISGSVMAEQQRGTLFFSILDTRLEDLL